MKSGLVRILAIFAHPDDEIFCAGGTLARHAQRGAEIMVVSATQGDAGQIRDASVATRRTLGKVRAQELLHSCERLGVQQAVCLDYGDGRLQSIDPLPLIRELVEIIRTFKPDVVITFGPDGAYGHPDHIVIGDLTTKAFHLACDPLQFPEQIRAGLQPYLAGRLYYSYFPRSRRLLSDQLVKWLVEIQQDFEGTIEFAYALMLFAEESAMLGYSSDNIDIQWYPRGFYIVEQGEPGSKLFLILSGQVEVVQEMDDGALKNRGTLDAGQFFGEKEMARSGSHTAHVVAKSDTTCMILSPHMASNFEGRGADAALRGDSIEAETGAAPGTGLSGPFPEEMGATTKIDVSAFIEEKVAALSAYRTQFPLEPSMFPMPMLRKVFSYEYFVRVYPPQELETNLYSMAEILSRR